ncbi:MAG TPA: SRPBCC domain-containing protein [Acidimicrobiales bacterium]|nr:SRPBCC domain-containing protein [Acidimicrobiales bacterium]
MNDDSLDQVRIERTFDAPVDVVWRMWTVPEHYQRWYGPFGASIPVAEMDVRVGGARRVCMEVDTPDGPRRMWFAGQYLQVEEHRLLVYSESVVDEGGRAVPVPSSHPAETEVQVELEDLGGTTRVVLIHRGIPADSPGATGWVMALDALAETLRQRRGLRPGARGPR